MTFISHNIVLSISHNQNTCSLIYKQFGYNFWDFILQKRSILQARLNMHLTNANSSALSVCLCLSPLKSRWKEGPHTSDRWGGNQSINQSGIRLWKCLLCSNRTLFIILWHTQTHSSAAWNATHGQNTLPGPFLTLFSFKMSRHIINSLFTTHTLTHTYLMVCHMGADEFGYMLCWIKDNKIKQKL